MLWKSKAVRFGVDDRKGPPLVHMCSSIAFVITLHVLGAHGLGGGMGFFRYCLMS